MIDSRFVLSAAVFCVAFSLNAEAKLYKWVDKNGTTHYGETIPPEYADRDTKQIEKGRVKERDETFGADKQRSANSDLTPEQKEAKEKRRQDEALLNTYTNEQEIDLARDRNLLQIEARINSFTLMLKSAQTTLNELHKESDTITKEGRKIPPSLTEDITEAEALVAKRQASLDTNVQERETVKARYEASKKRFRELKGLPDSNK